MAIAVAAVAVAVFKLCRFSVLQVPKCFRTKNTPNRSLKVIPFDDRAFMIVRTFFQHHSSIWLSTVQR